MNVRKAVSVHYSIVIGSQHIYLNIKAPTWPAVSQIEICKEGNSARVLVCCKIASDEVVVAHLDTSRLAPRLRRLNIEQFNFQVHADCLRVN